MSLKNIVIGVIVIMLAAAVGIGIVGAAILNNRPSANVQAQSAGDTASIYFSDLYQADGLLPLHTWQPITVYGETFSACVVEHLGTRSTLTVNPEDSHICGNR